VPKGFRPGSVESGGDHILLLGETREELSGSTWADVIHDHLGGLPPAVDFAAEQALAGLLRRAIAEGLVASAHDLSDGGLAVALVESALSDDVGATVELDDVADGDPFIALFSESTARVLVTVAEADHEAFVQLAEDAGVELASIGRTGGSDLAVAGQFSVSIAALRADWEVTLPAVLGPKFRSDALR
jgi:phosphoribosylformylglycinamidine (FGAM) synthase-like enzyme